MYLIVSLFLKKKNPDKPSNKREQLVLAKNLNIRKLLIKIDAQTVIDVIKSHSAYLDSTHPYNGLITNCRLLL